MRTRLILSSVALCVLAACAFSRAELSSGIVGPDSSEPAASLKPRTLRPFTSRVELKQFFDRARERQERRNRSDKKSNANAAMASPSSAQADGVGTSVNKLESITNTQHAGVDEGGIVKMHGDHLVILRRGRLFTVKIGDNSLRPVSTVDAFAPGVNPNHDWYDEMLISGDTIAVIGYSYGRGGTEINLFDIDRAGTLDYRSTYHLRSNDYYSSRNYASRLIGDKLIFYTPQYLNVHGEPLDQFPAIRRWAKGVGADDFMQIVEATSVYRVDRPDEQPDINGLHTVTVCDLSSGFRCRGTSVIGAPGRVFYVSPEAVYVWTTSWNYRHTGRPNGASMLYRMPLDGSAPSAMGVSGAPVDQFSFLEDDGDHLNILVRSDGYGEQMWGSEFAAGDVALFRTDISRFGDGTFNATASMYRQLPKPAGYTFQNRFVGAHLLYGTGSGWGYPTQKRNADLFAVDYRNGDVSQLVLDHGVDRIEQLGSDAIVIGTGGSDLYFTPVRLGSRPETRRSFVRRNATQGELRSHGFFYRSTGRNTGILGLPVARQGRPGYRHLVEGSAAITFLRNSGLELSEAGELEAESVRNADDNCRASCVDWYGNARPIFIGNRIFALMGYELVEGEIEDGSMREVRRVNYLRRRASS